MNEDEVLKKGRRGLLFVSTITYLIVFGGVCTWVIFKFLPSPWEWIVAVPWLAWVLPQPIGYFLGNGKQMDERYIETGDPDVFNMDDFRGI
jgi:hypothetical protein